MIQPSPSGSAATLLTVVATLLPLLAVLLQFSVRFYQSSGADGVSVSNGREAILFILMALGVVAYAGILLGEVVKTNSGSAALSSAVSAIQMAFGLLVAAGLLLGRDIIEGVIEGTDPTAEAESTNNEASKAEHEETTDAEKPEEET